MRVTISHNAKTEGMLRKITYFEVTVAVQFTSGEHQVIGACDLGEVTVLERPPQASIRKRATSDGDIFNLRVSSLLRGPDAYTCETPLEAKNYDAQLREALPKLKAYLDANATPMSGSDMFEL